LSTPLDTKALLGAAWDQVSQRRWRQARRLASPEFLAIAPPTWQACAPLKAYLGQNSSPEGFIAAHSMIRGMVHFADEGHTYFLDQQQYKDYQSWSRGDNTYVGIGISVSSREAEPRIVEVYDDTPAALAGLRAGDILVRIAGKSVGGLALDEMTGLVRGAAGTSVEPAVCSATSARSSPSPSPRAAATRGIWISAAAMETCGSRPHWLIGDLRASFRESGVDSIEQDVAKFRRSCIRGLVPTCAADQAVASTLAHAC
jgi:hypothetical protein